MEHFQQKWEPVLRFESATMKSCEHFQQKWEPVLRFESATMKVEA